jgi:hypothetical protein
MRLRESTYWARDATRRRIPGRAGADRPYAPAWWKWFAVEEEMLDQAIREWVTGGIHHVGSTAVAGLAAKPVVDILVGVTDLTSSLECFDRLAELNYQYAPHRVEEMHWFCKPDPAHRTHHLHLVPTGSPATEQSWRSGTLCAAGRTSPPNTPTSSDVWRLSTAMIGKPIRRPSRTSSSSRSAKAAVSGAHPGWHGASNNLTTRG